MLVGFEGLAGRALHPLPLQLSRVSAGRGEWRYPGIPDGALLELRGQGDRGARRITPLRAGSALVMTARWP